MNYCACSNFFFHLTNQKQSLDNESTIETGHDSNFLRKRGRDDDQMDQIVEPLSSEVTIDELATTRQLIQRTVGVEIEAVEMELATTNYNKKEKKKKKKKKKKRGNRFTEAPTPELSSSSQYSIPTELVDCLLRALPRRPARKRKKKTTDVAAIERRAEEDYESVDYDEWMEEDDDDSTEHYDRDIYDFLYQDQEENFDEENFMDDDDLMSYVRRLQTDPEDYDQVAVSLILTLGCLPTLWNELRLTTLCLFDLCLVVV